MCRCTQQTWLHLYIQSQISILCQLVWTLSSGIQYVLVDIKYCPDSCSRTIYCLAPRQEDLFVKCSLPIGSCPEIQTLTLLIKCSVSVSQYLLNLLVMQYCWLLPERKSLLELGSWPREPSNLTTLQKGKKFTYFWELVCVKFTCTAIFLITYRQKLVLGNGVVQ